MMLHKLLDDTAWFAPKRYGYGSGLPIRWQGWLLYGAYLAIVAGIAVLDRTGARPGEGNHRAIAFTMLVVTTALLCIISARHTRGGWKWRWGND